jgi:parallel beta-helix repeat protein
MKNLILILNLIFVFLLSGCLENGVKTLSSASSIGSQSKPTYSWESSLWSICSATECGTSGTQTRTVTCKKNSNIVANDSFCVDPKPETSQICFAPKCSPPPLPTYTYSWVVGTWSACSATACGTQGVQTRSVICKRDDGVSMADSYCVTVKPAASQPCAAAACPPPPPSYVYSWAVSSWGSCSATACGTQGVQSRTVTCKRDDGVSVADSYCTTAKPLASQSCSAVACSGAFTPPVRNRGIASVNVKDFGALGNGIRNDTTSINNAINSLPSTGGTVNIPAGTYMIDTLVSVKPKSNMLLKLDPNAILKAIPNSVETGSYVVWLYLVHDVEISGGQIIGERDEHVGITGEWGHGVMFRGSQHVTIRDIKISKNWGDGICIGAYKKRPITYADDTVIYNVIATQNRRQGLSIGNAINVKVYNSEFSYTEGTAPQFGIDIEPDNFDTVYNYANNIEIVNCKLSNNKGGGVQFYNRTSNILLKGNTISYNGLGVYTHDSRDSKITENLISHNRHKGTVFQTDSDNISTSNNIYRNNNTDQYGITNDTNPLVTITGLKDGTGGNGTTPHVGIAVDAKIINILTNQYAK